MLVCESVRIRLARPYLLSPHRKTRKERLTEVDTSKHPLCFSVLPSRPAVTSHPTRASPVGVGAVLAGIVKSTVSVGGYQCPVDVGEASADPEVGAVGTETRHDQHAVIKANKAICGRTTPSIFVPRDSLSRVDVLSHWEKKPPRLDTSCAVLAARTAAHWNASASIILALRIRFTIVAVVAMAGS